MMVYCNTPIVSIIEVGVLHRGKLIPNNSMVTVDDIGEDLESVICFTNEEDCCVSNDGNHWYFPDDTVVPSMASDVYGRSGPSTVSLNRMSGAGISDGLFRCVVIDMAGNNQTLYLGVYSNTTGT